MVGPLAALAEDRRADSNILTTVYPVNKVSYHAAYEDGIEKRDWRN